MIDNDHLGTESVSYTGKRCFQGSARVDAHKFLLNFSIFKNSINFGFNLFSLFSGFIKFGLSIFWEVTLHLIFDFVSILGNFGIALAVDREAR
jgi:hypothetical protein